MSDTVAFCIMVFVIVSTIHYECRPYFLDKGQLLIVAFIDTMFAVGTAMATDGIIQGVLT